MSDSIALAVKADSLVKDTCYRQIVFEGTSDVRTWDLTLYSSPDERFLASDLLDMSLDPIEENRQKNQQLMCALSANKGASKGSDHAPVTVIEFSDFQCPFCRAFADMIREVLETERDRVRVVFHHFPLSNHPWARMAAEGAACAQLQGSDAFWYLHDRLFKNQALTTPDSIKAELIQYASQGPMDLRAFRDCLENETSLGIVLRDINLAAAHQVGGTPTVFVNGKRFAGVTNAQELRRIIAEADESTIACNLLGTDRVGNPSGLDSIRPVGVAKKPMREF